MGGGEGIGLGIGINNLRSLKIYKMLKVIKNEIYISIVDQFC